MHALAALCVKRPVFATMLIVALMVVGYGLLELALVVLAVPILLAEGALLLSLAWPAAQTPGVAAPM